MVSTVVDMEEFLSPVVHRRPGRPKKEALPLKKKREILNVGLLVMIKGHVEIKTVINFCVLEF